MIIIPFVSPAGKILSTYEHRVPLTGTGPFSVGEYFLPDGWVVHIVGTTLVFTGMATEVSTGFDASFEIFSCCDCDPVTLTTSIVINSGCTYSWSMNPTIATVGTPVKTTFTPPRSCPLDAVLRLDVFRADGVTPYVELAISAEPLVITIPAGSSTYVIQASDAGADILFKPSTQQSACLTTCTPSNTSQRRIVPPRSDCNIIWGFTTYQFAAGAPTKQTFSVTGLPKGGIAAFDLYVGNVLQDYGDVVLSYENPSVTVGPLTFPAFSLGTDFNYRPRSPLLGAAVGCRILPARKDFDVVAGVVCAINWGLNTNSFPAGVPTPQTYSATGIPVGGGVAFDLYIGNVLQTYGDFTLTEAVPSVTPGNLTFPAAVIGSDFNYRPRTPSLNTATACTVTPSKIPFSVTGLVCSINWDLSTKSFFSGVPANQTISATGLPANCAVKFELYLGNVLQTFGDVTLTADNPSVTNTGLNFPSVVVGADYNYRPASPLVGVCSPCSVSPSRIDFDIVASGGCVIQWDLFPSPVAVGQSSGIRVLSSPPNCLVSFQAYQADGTTLVPGAVITILTDASGVGASAHGICTSAGTAVWKPVTPQPAACAASCTFGIASFVHVCSLNPGGVLPPAPVVPPTGVNKCAAGTSESGTSSTFPITWRESTALNEYTQVVTTQFTNANPAVVRASIPFTILPAATSLGVTNMPYIAESSGVGASAIATRTSVSRNRCDFTVAPNVTYPLGTAVTHTNTFSVNDATLANGGEFNLTTGQWYYNIEFPVALSGSYNYNRILDFTWLA